jgi:hypothetical protein
MDSSPFVRVQYRTIFVVFASLTFFLTKPVSPQSAKPNLSGTWELNLSKSKLSRAHKAKSDRYKIRHSEPQLVMEYTYSGDTETFYYRTDGKERPPEPQHWDILAKAYWDGDTLVIEKRQEIDQFRMLSVSRFTLSQDGQSLAVVRHATRNSFSLDLDESLVYERRSR